MTRAELRRYLEMLELSGEAVVVHAKLSSLGLDEGLDPYTFCELLVEAVGSGTLLMPAFTPSTLVLPPNPANGTSLGEPWRFLLISQPTIPWQRHCGTFQVHCGANIRRIPSWPWALWPASYCPPTATITP